MKIILHLIDNDQTEPPILHLRAAMTMFKEQPGAYRIVTFENGEMYEVRRNKQSVSVCYCGKESV